MPTLPLVLHNPLLLSEKAVEDEAEEETIELIVAKLREEYDQLVASGTQKRYGYMDASDYENDETAFEEDFFVFFEDELKGDDLFDPLKKGSTTKLVGKNGLYLRNFEEASPSA